MTNHRNLETAERKWKRNSHSRFDSVYVQKSSWRNSDSGRQGTQICAYHELELPHGSHVCTLLHGFQCVRAEWCCHTEPVQHTAFLPTWSIPRVRWHELKQALDDDAFEGSGCVFVMAKDCAAVLIAGQPHVEALPCRSARYVDPDKVRPETCSGPRVVCGCDCANPICVQDTMWFSAKPTSPQ